MIKLVRKNVELLKAMQVIIEAMNDEEAYFTWITWWIPDAPTPEDFEDCAADEEHMQQQCEIFRHLIRRYGREGFFTGGKVY